MLIANADKFRAEALAKFDDHIFQPEAKTEVLDVFKLKVFVQLLLLLEETSLELIEGA